MTALTPTQTAPTTTPRQLASLPWQAVDSSNLLRLAFVPDESASYDGFGRGTVFAEFRSSKDGDRFYSYPSVYRARWQQLLAADSIGRFFNLTIKKYHAARRFDLELSCSEVAR